MKNFIVAIDGPAGSGKSTVAKILAKKYAMTYLDTGAMYRMCALYFIENEISIDKKKNIEEHLPLINIDIEKDKFFLNGKDVSLEIRTPKVTGMVSYVAKIKEIREKMVELQRKISEGKDVILDGRDIGTVVFPNADLKIFLVASPEERAKRRMKDYEEKGIHEDYEKVLASILERDFIDSTRKEGPLKKANDAVEISTDGDTIDETVAKLGVFIGVAKEKKARREEEQGE
ncbi:MAG: (d)CMP kinase [Fusobacterium sp.]|jgi:cytidylate kinase|uniref:(d)CMP kinase n=1 Tax=Fusobacterium sp. TaxID=68766 RepID=UPI002A75EC16|nr:(d)CMP kinase [Fusobacterium sp.]MDY2981600.1 (d)CMP kinase [Fusobacterium sp.]